MSNTWKEYCASDIYNSGLVEYAESLVGGYGADIIQDCMVKLFSMDEEKLRDIFNRGKHVDYFFLTLRNTAYNYIRKRKLELVEFGDGFDLADTEYKEHGNEIIDIVREWADEYGSMWWYHSRLISLYAEEGTYRKVAAKTGIPHNSVSRSIRDFQMWLKEICTELKIDI